MEKPMDFIITSLQPWDIAIGSTIKNTALEISKENRVLYVSTPLDTMSYLRNNSIPEDQYRRKVLRKEVPLVRQINKNMWVVDCPFLIHSVSKLPTEWLFDWVNHINNKKIGKYILKKAAELNFKDYILLIDTDIYRSQYLKEIIMPKLSIYYCRDFVIGNSYWKSNGKRLEDRLAANSDVVLANSTYFAKRFETLNPVTYPIETGVNIELYDGFKSYATPDDIASIKRPIVGYIGSVNSTRLDIPLMAEVAKRCPDVSFVFVGPEDDTFKVSELHDIENVYFLGQKNLCDVPAYINAFDVGINPQLVNDVTIGNYPLKADEYLALGKPMVATTTHTMTDVFKDYTHLANNVDDWVGCIRTAIAEVGNDELKQRRIEYAHSHSWGHSVKKIYKIIAENLNKA